MKRLLAIICLFKSRLDFQLYIIDGQLQFTYVSGHAYVLDFEDDSVQVLKCGVCGHVSIGHKGVRG